MVVDGIERRARRIYVPRAAALLNWVRPVLSGPIADRVVARQTGRLIPQMEAEVASLDRAFGSHVEAATVDTARD
jgi:hypothetical protein